MPVGTRSTIYHNVIFFFPAYFAESASRLLSPRIVHQLIEWIPNEMARRAALPPADEDHVHEEYVDGLIGLAPVNTTASRSWLTVETSSTSVMEVILFLLATKEDLLSSSGRPITLQPFTHEEFWAIRDHRVVCAR